MANCLNFNGIDIEAINFNGEINIDTININGFEIKCSEEFICSLTETFTKYSLNSTIKPILMSDGKAYQGATSYKGGILEKNVDIPTANSQFAFGDEIFYITTGINGISKYNIQTKQYSKHLIDGLDEAYYMVEYIGNNLAVAFRKLSTSNDKCIIFDIADFTAVVTNNTVTNNNVPFLVAGRQGDKLSFCNSYGRIVIIDSVAQTIQNKVVETTAVGTLFFLNTHNGKQIFTHLFSNVKKIISVDLDVQDSTNIVYTTIKTHSLTYNNKVNTGDCPIIDNYVYWRTTTGLYKCSLVDSSAPTLITSSGSVSTLNSNILYDGVKTLYWGGLAIDITNNSVVDYSTYNWNITMSEAILIGGELFWNTNLYMTTALFAGTAQISVGANNENNYYHKNKKMRSCFSKVIFYSDYTKAICTPYMKQIATSQFIPTVLITDLDNETITEANYTALVFPTNAGNSSSAIIGIYNDNFYFAIGSSIYKLNLISMEFSSVGSIVSTGTLYLSRVGNKFIHIGVASGGAVPVRVFDPTNDTITLTNYPSTLMSPKGFWIEDTEFYVALLGTNQLVAIKINSDNTCTFGSPMTILGTTNYLRVWNGKAPKDTFGNYYMTIERHLFRFYIEGGVLKKEDLFNYFDDTLSSFGIFYSRGKIVCNQNKYFCTQDLNVKGALTPNPNIIDIDISNTQFVYGGTLYAK